MIRAARVRVRSELGRFSMKAHLFREINGRFLLDELGDPFKYEEFFITQFWNIPVNSLLQRDFRRFTGTVKTLDFPIISLVSFLRQFLDVLL